MMFADEQKMFICFVVKWKYGMSFKSNSEDVDLKCGSAILHKPRGLEIGKQGGKWSSQGLRETDFRHIAIQH